MPSTMARLMGALLWITLAHTTLAKDRRSRQPFGSPKCFDLDREAAHPEAGQRQLVEVTASAALCPGAPVTPPPGCAPEPQR
jgi:hypothetical protein